MDIKLVLLFLSGVVAGFINIMAGGGSLITIPLLIFLGLPPTVANGTNRVAVLVQNVIATSKFKKSGHFYWKTGLILTVPAVLGALLGSKIAVSMSDVVFKRLLAVVMVISLIMVLLNKDRMALPSRDVRIKNHAPFVAAFFLIGIYGGVVQAGVGFFIILVLALVPGLSLVQINSLKIFIILCYMVPSLLLFFLYGKVNWIYGLVLAAGSAIGGWLGVSLSVRRGDKLVKVVFAVAVTAMAVKLGFG